MDDPGVGRHHGEVFERPLAPAQEQVALLVALELALRVEAEGVAGAEGVHLDRVIDHQLGRGERVDAGRIPAHVGHRVAHGGEVDDRRNPGEVLQQHAGGGEGDLLAGVGLGVPAGEGLDVRSADRAVALGPQQVLEQDLQRERQARHVVLALEHIQPEDLILALADRELVPGTKAVLRHRLSSQSDGGQSAPRGQGVSQSDAGRPRARARRVVGRRVTRPLP